MHAKGYRLLLLCVMITLAGGCDNVAFEGIQVELRPPPGSMSELGSEEGEAPSVESGPSPLELGPILYIVETLGGSRASILPIAELGAEGYRSLPDLPDLVVRFPLQRLEGGEEFTLFTQGVRVGTFISDGMIEADASACLLRPRGAGRVEVRPEAASHRRFLAMRRGDVPGEDPTEAFEPVVEDLDFRNGSVDVARRVMQATGAFGPESISGIRRNIQPIDLGDGRGFALAATFVYEGTLVVGVAPPEAYSVFVVGEKGETRYEPIVGWYQRSGGGGKAFPRLMAAHDVRGSGVPDLILEVFGIQSRWLSILGEGASGWQLLYQDACAEVTAPESLRSFR